MSDHTPISFLFTQDHTRLPPKRVFNWKKADWNQMNEFLLSEKEMLIHRSLNEASEIDDFVKDFTDLITRTIEIFVPKKTIFPRNSEWWTEKLESLKKKYKKIKRKRNSSLEEVKYAKQNYENEIIKSKTDSWRKFVDSTKSNGDLFMLHKIMSKKKGRMPTKMIRKDSGQMTRTLEERADVLMNTLFRPYSLNLDYHRKIEQEANSILQAYEFNMEPDIMEQELDDVIENLNTSKAAGPDRIPSKFYKMCHSSISEPLLILYNSILKSIAAFCFPFKELISV